MTTVKTFRFSNGEVAPTFHDASDLESYLTSLRLLRNAFVGKSGGAHSRAGTSVVAVSDAAAGAGRLIPFVFNSSQTYVLEFYDFKMRVIRNGALVTLTGQNLTGATNANPCVVTYSGADTYANGDEVLISGVVGMEELNNRVFIVSNVNTAANTFELASTDSSAYGTYASGGTVAEVYSVVSPFAGTELETLQYAQDSDVMYLTSESQPPQELARSSHTSWTFTAITFGADSTLVTAGLTNSVPGAAGTTYVVTKVDPATGEEGIEQASSTTDSTGNPFTAAITVTWTASGSHSYNIYRRRYGSVGLIGVSTTGVFVDNGVAADYTIQPPKLGVYALSSPTKYPRCVGFSQQRSWFARSETDPDTVWALQTGRPKNHYVRRPPQDDDAFQFRPSSLQANEIRHVLGHEKPFIFTSGGEFVAQGNDAGVVTPTAINLKQIGAYGSSTLRPLVVSGAPVLVQARGNVIRGLGLEIQGFKYRGDDLSALASHLFEGRTLVDWAHQQSPVSIIWAVRDDGVLLSFTYLPDRQIWAWARHDSYATFDSFERARFTNVCVVPEGDEDAVYFVVWRNNGAFIERLNTRRVQPTELLTVNGSSLGSYSYFGRRDFVGMDAALTYDGRNTTGTHSMTLTGGMNWTFDETLTLTSSSAFFSSLDVGNEIHLYYVGPIASTSINIDYQILDTVRLTITAYTSTTVVSVQADKTVPATMRAIALPTWARAVDVVTGLWHLNDENVSVLGDGYVVASPFNPQYATLTVSNGRVTLPQCYAVIHVGLPHVTDLETLDIDNAQGSLTSRKKNVSKVTASLEKSLGLWVGGENPDENALNTAEEKLYGLCEMKVREAELLVDPTELQTGKVPINIETQWSQGGRVFLRRVDPVPLSVLAIAPTLVLGEEG